MTDRELLKLAAKAAKIKIDAWDENKLYRFVPGTSDIVEWNPLTDDGDALRLAVQLRLCVAVEPVGDIVFAKAYGEKCVKEDFMQQLEGKSFQFDPCAATRRAIVRAAAEIGRAMP